MHLLEGAGCLLATADSELEAIRRAGLKNAVAVIPNGIDTDVVLPTRRRRPDIRSALFLSRIHPKKGLEFAIEAWDRLRPKGWRFDIMGPGDTMYISQLKRKVESQGLQDVITFHSPVWDAARFQCFRDADLFVLPTMSENFGLVVAEALLCEVPVITTRGTPWRSLDERGCGRCVDTGVDGFYTALHELTNKPRDVLDAMGTKGRSWVRQEFAWDRVASMCTEVYRWVLGRGPQPAFVYTR